MVETHSSDDDRPDTLDSDDDAEQLKAVSQEEEQCEEVGAKTYHNTWNRSNTGIEATASLATT
jgi:hypothetical protein